MKRHEVGRILKLYFVLLMKSHLQSYPCPLQINSFWNLGFLLGITIFLQIITGIFLGLHYTSDLNSAYSSLFFLIREIFYGWCLRYLHSSGASFVFLFLFLHFGRAISYGSYFYNPNTWFSGIIIFLFLMATAFMGYVLPFGQMSFWGATVITNLFSEDKEKVLKIEIKEQACDSKFKSHETHCSLTGSLSLGKWLSKYKLKRNLWTRPGNEW